MSQMILDHPQSWWTARVYAYPNEPLKLGALKLYRASANPRIMRRRVGERAGVQDRVTLSRESGIAKKKWQVHAQDGSVPQLFRNLLTFGE